MQFTDIRSLIAWIIESGGAGVLSYWALMQLDKRTKIKEWPGEWKRVLAIAQAAIIGALVAFLGRLIGVYRCPDSPAGWANLMFAVGATAALGQQLTHGFCELPRRER